MNSIPTTRHDSIYYELYKIHKTTNVKQAIVYAKQAVCFSSKHRHVHLQASALRALGYMYDEDNKVDSSALYNHKAIRLSLLHNLKDVLIDSYNDLGLLYKRLDVYDSALQYFILSRDLSYETKAHKPLARANQNIGLVYFYIGNKIEALDYFKEAIKIKNSNAITDGINLNLINLARTLNELGRSNEAISALKKVKLNCKTGCDDIMLADLNYQFGYSFLKKNEDKTANDFFRTALAIARKADANTGANTNKVTIANSLYHLSSSSIKAEDYLQALKYLEEAEKISLGINHRRLLVDIYLSLSNVYLKTGSVNRALDYQQLYSKLQQDIFNKDVANNIKNIQLSKQRKESDAVIQEKETKLWNARILVIILTLNFAIALAIAFIIYRLLKASRLTKKGMANNMINMLAYRKNSDRDVYRAELEADAIKIRVRAFLSGPVATLGGLGHLFKKATTLEELNECVDSLNWYCANITTVLESLDELIEIKKLDVTPQALELKVLANDIQENFKTINSFLHLTITIHPSVQHDIVSDNVILLALVKNAIMYFGYAAKENPVVEIVFEQIANLSITKITVRHYYTGNASKPDDRHHFNHLIAIIAAEKINASIDLIRCEEFRCYEFCIPTVLNASERFTSGSFV